MVNTRKKIALGIRNFSIPVLSILCLSLTTSLVHKTIDAVIKIINNMVNHWNFGNNTPREDEKNKSKAINITESVVRKPINTE